MKIVGVELFCADGYFSNYAVMNGVSKMTGIDLEERSGEGNERGGILEQARLITSMLGNDKKVAFERGDVFNLSNEYDLCLCVGGLYHISKPEELLSLLRKKIRQILIIQTVVSLENESPDYFVSPVPGWTWGCRFSHQYLINMVKRAGWNIIEEERNQLIANNKPSDRGSSYLLCERR